MSDFDAALERLVSEPAFRDALATDPQRALAGYRLSPDELEVLTSQLDTGSGGQRHVEQRTSKASLFGLLSPMSGMGGFAHRRGRGRAAAFGAPADRSTVGRARASAPTTASPARVSAPTPGRARASGRTGQVAATGPGASFGDDGSSQASFGDETTHSTGPGTAVRGWADGGPRRRLHERRRGRGAAWTWTAARPGRRTTPGSTPTATAGGTSSPRSTAAAGASTSPSTATTTAGVDWVGHDLDRDGLIDEASVDHNYDGTLETRWVDQDGDGWMDARQPWPDPAAGEPGAGGPAAGDRAAGPPTVQRTAVPVPPRTARGGPARLHPGQRVRGPARLHRAPPRTRERGTVRGAFAAARIPTVEASHTTAGEQRR